MFIAELNLETGEQNSTIAVSRSVFSIEVMAATSPTAKLDLERENLAWLKEQCSESERLTSGMVRGTKEAGET